VHRNLGKREESMQTMRKPDTMQTKFATQPQKKLFGKCKKFELKTQKKIENPKIAGVGEREADKTVKSRLYMSLKSWCTAPYRLRHWADFF
jgi:hypothetical protein